MIKTRHTKTQELFEFMGVWKSGSMLVSLPESHGWEGVIENTMYPCPPSRREDKYGEKEEYVLCLLNRAWELL